MATIKSQKISAQAEEAITTFFDRVDEQAILDFLAHTAGALNALKMETPSVATGRELLKRAAVADEHPGPQQVAHALMRLCMVSCEFITQMSSTFIHGYQIQIAEVFGAGFYEAALAIDERADVRELLKTLPVQKNPTLDARRETGRRLLEELARPAKLALGLD